ncbi:hypothetical protein GVAV_002067 [Gurleya vavrai]
MRFIILVNTYNNIKPLKNTTRNEIKYIEACALRCKEYLNDLITNKNKEEMKSIDLLIVDYFSLTNTNNIFETLQKMINIAYKDHYRKSKKIIRNLSKEKNKLKILYSKKNTDEHLKLYEQIIGYLTPEHLILNKKSKNIITSYFENHFRTSFFRFLKIYISNLPNIQKNLKFKDIVDMMQTIEKLLTENFIELENSVLFKSLLKDNIQKNIQYALDKSIAIFESLKKNKICSGNIWYFLDGSKEIYAHTIKLIYEQLKKEIKNCDEVYKFFKLEKNKSNLECEVDMFEHKNEKTINQNHVKELDEYEKDLFLHLKNSIHLAFKTMYYELNKENFDNNLDVESKCLNFDRLFETFYSMLFYKMHNEIFQQSRSYEYIINTLSKTISEEIILTQANFDSLFYIFFCENLVDCDHDYDNLNMKILKNLLKPKTENFETYNLLIKFKKNLLPRNDCRFEIYSLEFLKNNKIIDDRIQTYQFKINNAVIIEESFKIFIKYFQRSIKPNENLIQHELKKLFHVLDIYNYNFLINLELYQLDDYCHFESYQLLEYINKKWLNEKPSLKGCFREIRNDFAIQFENIFFDTYYDYEILQDLKKENYKNYDVKFFKKKFVKKRIHKNFEIILKEFTKIIETYKKCETVEDRLNFLDQVDFFRPNGHNSIFSAPKKKYLYIKFLNKKGFLN